MNFDPDCYGTTAARPTNAGPGYCYFDTTLGKPIWRDETNDQWVLSDGTNADAT